MRALFPKISSLLRIRPAPWALAILLGLSIGGVAAAAPVSWGDIFGVQSDLNRARSVAVRSMAVPLAATTAAMSTHPNDAVLVARADVPGLSGVPISIAGVSLSDAIYTPLVQEARPPAPASTERAFASNIRLPEPGGWTSVLATLALAVFFFLRRLN